MGILLSIVYQYNNLLAHLVPVGTPSFLMPVIVIIERVRNVIRPATLAIRLAANILAGLFIGLILLLLLEVAVACIQSYVFTVLSSLYLAELIRVEYNKKMI